MFFIGNLKIKVLLNIFFFYDFLNEMNKKFNDKEFQI